ncbi:MAG: 50S ribosomal protein L11 methyltransferase [Fimbriimonadia bacterium]
MIEETDWSEAWKAFFRPRRIGRRLVVCPSWEQAEAGPDDIVLDLDPGQAFGTGEHPTTQMCLELLEQHIRPGDKVLDIGVGSGILSIAALKLGADRAVCCDVDPVSVAAARENLQRNGCGDKADVVLAEGIRWCRAMFDLVVSNIVSATLVRLAGDVAARSRPGGAWILSGVSRDNENGVLAACGEAGFAPVERREEGEWVALLVRR